MSAETDDPDMHRTKPMGSSGMDSVAQEASPFADSRSSDPMPALRRAALRAREIARQTNTPLVFARDGKIIHLMPDGSELEVSPRRPSQYL